MAISSGSPIFYNLTPNVRVILIPLTSLVILTILSIFVFKDLYSRISLERLKLDRVRKDGQVLQQKQIFLQEVKEQVLSLSDSTLLALPDTNSALLEISQLKSLADKNAVTLENLGVGGQDLTKGEISSVILSFDVLGNFENVLNFLDEIQSSAPLARLENVKMAQAGSSTLVRAGLKVFWSELPTTIPAINEPVVQLAQNEQEVLNVLLELSPPPFFATKPAFPTVSEISEGSQEPAAPAQVTSSRKNPFRPFE